MPGLPEPPRDAVAALLDCRTRDELLRALRTFAVDQLATEDLELWFRPEDRPWRAHGASLALDDRPSDGLVLRALEGPRVALPSGWTLLRGVRTAVLVAGWGLEATSETVEAVLLLADALLPALAPSVEEPAALQPSTPAHPVTALDLLCPDSRLPESVARTLAALPLPCQRGELDGLLGRFRLELGASGSDREVVLAADVPGDGPLDGSTLAALAGLAPALELQEGTGAGPRLRLQGALRGGKD